MKRFITKIIEDSSQTSFDYLKELDNENFTLIKNSIRIIEEYQDTFDLFNILFSNYQEIIKSQKNGFRQLVSNIRDPLKLDKNDYAKLKIETNRTVLNYLGSFRTFLDHCDRKLNKRFGIDSEEYKKFQKFLNEAFDLYFEYRFIYKLRNYCQHCGLPVSNMVIENDGANISLTLYFDSNYLLDEYDSWGKIVKNDLIQINDQFMVNEVINTHVEIMMSISKKIDLLYEEILMKSVTYLESQTREYRDESDLVIFEDDQSSDDRKNIRITQFPFDVMDSIIDLR